MQAEAYKQQLAKVQQDLAAQKAGFEENNPVFERLESIIFPWTSSVSISKKSELEIKPLIETTNKSWIQQGQFNLNPQQEFKEKNEVI